MLAVRSDQPCDCGRLAKANPGRCSLRVWLAGDSTSRGPVPDWLSATPSSWRALAPGLKSPSLSQDDFRPKPSTRWASGAVPHLAALKHLCRRPKRVGPGLPHRSDCRLHRKWGNRHCQCSDRSRERARGRRCSWLRGCLADATSRRACGVRGPQSEPPLSRQPRRLHQRALPLPQSSNRTDTAEVIN